MSRIIDDFKPLIEKRLDELTAECDSSYARVLDAMRYSLLAGGKRIRPALAMEFCRVSGGNAGDALDFGCAVEMIHTYSLIHDDLPCMDNDDYRRGRLSCHKAFGEDIALLAGDALQPFAFETVANAALPSDRIAAATKSLAHYCGLNGMVGGQMIDISGAAENDIIRLTAMYSLKTSALIRTACELGCIAAGRVDLCAYAGKFAENLGLAFQIRDDILDVIGTAEQLGKPIGSDDKNGKPTYASFYGVDKAETFVKEYSDRAKASLELFGAAADDLKELTDLLSGRNC